MNDTKNVNDVLLIDEPLPLVRRLTLNRPEKRNALNDDLRGGLFAALRDADADREVSVVIIRGAGTTFSAGYDLASPNHDVERAIAKADGWWSRHVVNNWFEMWDMATPIVGQVHGYCLAGGTELATACDLVYVAEDAEPLLSSLPHAALTSARALTSTTPRRSVDRDRTVMDVPPLPPQESPAALPAPGSLSAPN